MKNSKWLFIIFFAQASIAQVTESPSERMLHYNNIEFGSSLFPIQNIDYTLNELNSFMLSGELPVSDYTGFESELYGLRFMNSIRHLGIGFHLKNQDGSHLFANPMLRFEVGYVNHGYAFGNFRREQRETIDSVYVEFSPDLHYVDSVSRENIFVNASAHVMLFNLLMLWQTDPKKRFCFYGGLGLGVGFSVRSTLNYEYSLSSNTEIRNPNGGIHSISNSYNTSDRADVKGIPWQHLSVRVPFGFDLRFATYTRFWRNVHFFFEAGPALWVRNIPGTQAQRFAHLYLTWGFRFRMFDAI